MEKKKKLWQVLIPVLVALAVIVAFAISGIRLASMSVIRMDLAS